MLVQQLLLDPQVVLLQPLSFHALLFLFVLVLPLPFSLFLLSLVHRVLF